MLRLYNWVISFPIFYATSQVADLPRPDRRDIDMVSIALKFSGIENDI